MKYINADRLIHDLEERIYAYSEGYADGDDCRKDAIETLLKDVKYQLSLQKELDRMRYCKDYPYVPGWRLNKENNKPEIKHSVLMLTTHGIAEGEWDGNEWIQYRWSCKNKDAEVLYWIHLEDLSQIEKEGDSLQEGQSEVDLEDEMEKFGERWPYPASFDGYDKDWVDELTEECAKHFYELGKKNMKEQMMKEAVEYEVGMHGEPIKITFDKYVQRARGIWPGDKVRIIIVKED